MPSPQTLEPCAEHKLDVENKNGEKIKRLQRAQWLRAAILGANDGLLSTASLMLGVGAAKETKQSMVLSGIAGALAGACSMAVGEFVSVSTQRDIERETTVGNCNSRTEIRNQDGGGGGGGGGGGEIKLHISTASANGTTVIETNLPLDETNFAVSPALSSTPSSSIPCRKLECEAGPSAMTPNQKFRYVLSSPARSPMMKVITGDQAKKITSIQEAKEEEEEDKERALLPNPYKAAGASALAFLCGSLVPLLAAMFIDKNRVRIAVIVAVTSIALVLFGGIGAHLGGSSVRTSAVRVLVGGWLSMALTYGLLKPLDREDDHKGHHTD